MNDITAIHGRLRACDTVSGRFNVVLMGLFCLVPVAGCNGPHAAAQEQEQVEIDWTFIKNGARLHMSIPRVCVDTITYRRTEDEKRFHRKADQIETGEVGKVYLRVLLPSNEGTTAPAAIGRCVPIKELQAQRDLAHRTTIVALRPNVVGENVAWRNDPSRSASSYQYSRGTGQHGMYLAGEYHGLREFRHALCPSEQTHPNLPYRLHIPAGSMDVDHPKGKGCADTLQDEGLFSPEGTPPEAYFAFRCTRADPAERSNCKSHSHYHGWGLEFSLNKAKLDQRVAVQDEIRVWLDQYLLDGTRHVAFKR